MFCQVKRGSDYLWPIITNQKNNPWFQFGHFFSGVPGISLTTDSHISFPSGTRGMSMSMSMDLIVCLTERLVFILGGFSWW